MFLLGFFLFPKVSLYFVPLLKEFWLHYSLHVKGLVEYKWLNLIISFGNVW